MKNCPSCGKQIKNGQVCTTCLQADAEERLLEQLVQKASVPNLASLYKAGRAAGLITPTVNYQHT